MTKQVHDIVYFIYVDTNGCSNIHTMLTDWNTELTRLFFSRTHISWRIILALMNVNYVWHYTTMRAAIWHIPRERSIKLTCKIIDTIPVVMNKIF